MNVDSDSSGDDADDFDDSSIESSGDFPPQRSKNVDNLPPDDEDHYQGNAAIKSFCDRKVMCGQGSG